MGVRLVKDSIENQFRAVLNPIIGNNINLGTKEEKLAFNRRLLSEYEGDSLSPIPECDCQKLKDGKRLGMICEECGTPVEFITEKSTYSNVWIEAPDGIDKLISPMAWKQLSQVFSFKHGKVNLLEWLVSRTYVIRGAKPKEFNALVKVMEDNGFERGLNYFFRNFERIAMAIFIPSVSRYNAKRTIGYRDYFLRCFKDGLIFSKWLPIPSKVTMVTEQNVFGKYVDDVLVEALDALYTISRINNQSALDMTPKRIEARTVKAIRQLANYHFTNFRKRYASKPGLFRQHVYSSRLDFSGRAVITSLTIQHDYDELHIPWSMGVNIFDIHIKSKLYRRGYSNRRAQALIQGYSKRYHPVLDEIMKEIIDEVGYCKGFPCLFLRNPSLARGSSQCLRITKVKPDPTDNTISFSILILSACNADFDGDEMTLTLILDKWMYERCRSLAPHNYVMSLSKPFHVSHHIGLPKPLISTMAHWLRSDY